jgi:AcrR family transcriptional regulator
MQAASAEPARYRVADESMLDAATAVFAAEGFDRATMEAIADRGSVTKPTLYARFGSKEKLFAAAVAREYEIRKARLFAAYGAGGGQPFRRRLHSWVTAHFDLVEERPEGFRLISEGERHPAAAEIIERAGQEIADGIAQLVRSVSGRGEGAGPHLVASMIAGMLRSCAQQALRSGADIGQSAALCESFLLAALRGVDPELLDAVGCGPRSGGAAATQGRLGFASTMARRGNARRVPAD